MFTLGAFAVILDDEDRVLLSHRTDLDLWNLPGGRVEHKELPTEAVIRETLEETGLAVTVMRLVGVYGRADEAHDLVFTFECRIIGGTPRSTSEADRHDWFSVDELPRNTIPKHVVRIQDALKRRVEPVFSTQSEPTGRGWLPDLESDSQP